MSEKKDEQIPASNNWPNSADVKAAEVIRNFTLFYPPDVAKEALWQLLSASMSGNCADDWNAHERSNMLLFYRLAGELVEVLPGLVPKIAN
jgi:hypothetical protein